MRLISGDAELLLVPETGGAIASWTTAAPSHPGLWTATR